MLVGLTLTTEPFRWFSLLIGSPLLPAAGGAREKTLSVVTLSCLMLTVRVDGLTGAQRWRRHGDQSGVDEGQEGGGGGAGGGVLTGGTADGLKENRRTLWVLVPGSDL